MRAVSYQEPGSADKVLILGELPDPEPGPGEVRVRVHFSSVNPTDVKRRASENPQHERFQIPHHDGSGIIDRLGLGVSSSRLGQRVWIYHGAHQRAFGTAADYICVPNDQAVELPPNFSLLTGAMIGIPMMTAAHALHLGGDLDGKHVLITGGAGAVGSAAISLAHSFGAHVTTTVSSEFKADVAREAGADFVINYRTTDVGEELKASGMGIDLVVDVALGANIPLYLPYLHNRARIINYSSDGPELAVSVRPLMFANVRMEFFVIFSIGQNEIRHTVEQVCEAITQNVLPILPAHEFAPQQCSQAHRHVENHEFGRAVIAFNE